MSVNATVRLSDEESQLIEKAAERLGFSGKADLLRTGGLFLAELDKWFWDRLKTMAREMRVSESLIVQNLVIKWKAEKDAFRSFYSGGPELLTEFVFTEDGPITGKQLYERFKSSEFKKIEGQYDQQQQELKNSLIDIKAAKNGNKNEE